jgi:hypothetical protein
MEKSESFKFQKHIIEHEKFKEMCLLRLMNGEIDFDTYRELVREHGFKKTRDIGHEAIMDTEVNIGGFQIEKEYDKWLDIWYELNQPRQTNLNRSHRRANKKRFC